MSKLSPGFVGGARREGREEFRRVAPSLLLRKQSNSCHEPSAERWVGVEKPFRGAEISELFSFIHQSRRKSFSRPGILFAGNATGMDASKMVSSKGKT